MSLLKNNHNFFLSFFLLFTNFWILKIFESNFLIGIILILLTIVIIFINNKKILILVLVILLITQYWTTEFTSLSNLDNDQQRVQQERIKSYLPISINLGFKILWFWPGLWIEQNNLVITLSRLEENLFENLDISKYFFGGFPRNDPSDFEKFPFIYLPIFLIGFYQLIKERKSYLISILFLIPILILSFIGNKNNLGPLVLFPSFIISFFEGIKFLKKYFKRKKLFYGVFIILVLITYILQISYEKF